MAVWPEGALKYAPAIVRHAWEVLLLANRTSKASETLILLMHDPGGMQVYGYNAPEEWRIGSNVEDGRSTVIYRPATAEWLLREPWTGEDEPVSYEKACNHLSCWGLF